MFCQVKVSQGVLQGKKCKTFYGKKYYSFEGIPYAKPPIGRLRFRDPQEPENWTGIRDATKPGNKCCQINPYGNTAFEGSEDSLYLNIYTPSLPVEKIEKLPVFFFVHGGRLIFGHGHYYRPDYILKHDVVFVTINYRLNVLGFLCLNIPEVPGNAGLKDSVAALRWVKKNIGFFNGNADNITIMGESAGAAVVMSLMTSKMADGLYHKIISQSGVSMSDLYMTDRVDCVEKAKMVASNLGKDLTDPNSLYEFLVDVPIEDLLIAFSAVEMSKPPSVIAAVFTPVVEKKFHGVENFFIEHPRVDIPLNRFNKVPLLIGMHSHEGALFLQRDSEGKIIFEEDFYFFVPTQLCIERDNKQVAIIEKKLREFYFNNRDVNEITISAYIDMVSDRYFSFDIMHNIEVISKFSPNVYAFRFQYNGNMNTRIMKNLGLEGGSHGDMIQYLFYRKCKHERATEKDLQIVEMLSEAWYNFAKNGTPSWSGQKTKWLPYTPTEKLTLVIDRNIELVRNPDSHRWKFWQGIIGESSKL
ncbi:unnamed protein product [Arctia plantaginis]|uniref:Carboxylesterase type B domain-containing protein n=1 Tax=Arctia plantaginis TaxID=874455 RepID=A0A8S1BEF0_ARCPL|nr:unnamed protein product [Arctia plantaginis]